LTGRFRRTDAAGEGRIPATAVAVRLYRTACSGQSAADRTAQGGANLFGFVHRDFLEYFCAMAFIHKFEKTMELNFEDLKRSVFGAHGDDPSWDEVLRMVAGIVSERFTAEIIRSLAVDNWWIQSIKNDQPPYHLSLSLKCLTDVRNLHPIMDTCDFVLKQLLGLYEQEMSDRPQQYFTFIKEDILAHVLTMESPWPSIDRLAEHLQNRQPAKFAYIYDRLFGTFIGKIGKNHPAIKEILFSHSKHEEDSIRVTVPFALAIGWHDDLDVLPLLKSMALEDMHYTVRYAATYAVSREYKEDPDTRRFLIFQATKNGHAFARATAISGLGDNYGNDSEIFDILCSRLQVEDDKFPRTNIVLVLGQYFAGRPEVLEILCRAALEDPSPRFNELRYSDPYYVREAAMEGLFKNWPVDPRTMEVLQDREKNDPNPWIRERAKAMLVENATAAPRES
jgi:hypothetical protein